MPNKLERVKKILDELSHKMAVAGWVDGNGSAQVAFDDMLLFKATGERSPSLKVEASYALIARTLCYGRQAGVTAEGRRYPAIPSRNFFNVARDLFSKEAPIIFKRHLPLVLNEVESVDAFMKFLGEVLSKCIEKAIRDGEYTPLSPATLKNRRQSSSPKPLIDTGSLINSISFEVRNS